MAKFDSCTGRRGAFEGTSAAAVAAMARIAERRRLGFAGELLRVRRTRLSPSFGGFAALRPAFLRLKALSLSQRFLWSRAACSSSVRGPVGLAVVQGSLLSWLVPDDARGPSLRQHLGHRSILEARVRPSPRA